MGQRLFALAFALILVACGQSEQGASQSSAEVKAKPSVEEETARLNAWFDERYKEELNFSPILMTFLGKKERYGEIDDVSEAAEREQLAWREATVVELKEGFDYANLTPDAQISYDLWIYQYEQEKAAAEFMAMGYMFHQMSGPQAFLPQFMINFHKVSELSDMEAYIQRLPEVGRAINQLLERAQQYAAGGVRPPKFAYEGVIQQSTNVITGQPFDESEQDSPLWADAKGKIEALLKEGKIDQAKANELRDSAKAALSEGFYPAYRALITWATEDMEKAAVNATGVSRHDKGVAFYNQKLAASTTTDLTAEEVHNIGLAEVERLTKEMEAIKKKVEFEGELKDFFTFIKSDDQFFYPDTDEGRLGYIEDSKKFLGYIEERLPEYFGVLPKADLVVKRVEAFREQPGAAQHYFPGTPDGSRPGIYYAHLSDMRAMPKNEMEAIAYHEGSPGHHMQISIAQELESVPEFRKQARFTSYVEGWALYAELLAKEMGAYQNDYNDFGRLITEIWRAVRLVVDTGLHVKGWTEEQAIEYFKEKTPIAEGAVKSEVQRYLVLPGQATAYKIGMIRIQELRAMAEQELGDKFDIRGFHDTILAGGAVPLSLLERRVKQWVDSVKNASA